MNYRMSDQDCVFARNEAITGTVASQVSWIFDRPVDIDGLRGFYDGLCRGRFGRVAAPAIIGPAGDRWTRVAEFAPLYVESRTVARDAFEDWLFERSREPLNTYGGPAWRLSVAQLDDGGGVVSLLVSHALADGYSLIVGISEAATGAGASRSYAADQHSWGRRLLADSGAAVRGVGRAGAALARLIPLYLGVRKELRPPNAPPPAHLTVHADQGHAVSRLTAYLPAEQWHAAAKARGGTHTTLSVAVMADLAQHVGRVRADGRVQIQMPAAIRTADNDQDANSLIFVGFDIDAGDGFAADLKPLRATMKQAYATDMPKAGAWADMWRLSMTTPRPLLRWAARKFPADLDPTITECSVVAELPRDTLRIDGGSAVALWATLCKDSESDADEVGRRGGLLRVAAGELDGLLLLRITASHNAAPEAKAEFRATVLKVLANYGLTGAIF